VSTEFFSPYRGCDVEVHVTMSRSQWLGGKYRRFRVSWTVTIPGGPARHLVSFPEQFDFLTEQEAFRYGEKRAHTFIDSMLTTPSQRRRIGSAQARARSGSPPAG
jgi:hypothetical protein